MEVDALELRLGRVLGIGGFVSTALFAAGLAVLSAGYKPISDAFFHAGLIMLFATPFARVIVTIVNYIRERDWLFVAMTTTVLLVLIGGVIVAAR